MATLNDLATDFTWIDTDAPSLDSETVRGMWRLTSGRGINESRQIAGLASLASETSNYTVQRSFRFDPIASEVRLLPTNGEAFTTTGISNSINEAGDVAYNNSAGSVFIYTGNYEGGNQLFLVLEDARVGAIGDGGELAGKILSTGYGFRYTVANGLETEPFVGANVTNISSDGTYVVGSKQPTTKRGGSTAFRYSDAEGMVLVPQAPASQCVNISGDVCMASADKSYLYMKGDGADYGLIDLTVQLGYSPHLTSITTRDDETGFPWMCGDVRINGVRAAVLIYPVPR